MYGESMYVHIRQVPILDIRVLYVYNPSYSGVSRGFPQPFVMQSKVTSTGEEFTYSAKHGLELSLL